MICGSFNNNGLITSFSSIYPIKYLSEFFVPYTTSLEINILLISISLKLNGFLLFLKKNKNHV